MGAKLGTVFARAGHEVVFSYARSEQKLKELAGAARGQARGLGGLCTAEPPTVQPLHASALLLPAPAASRERDDRHPARVAGQRDDGVGLPGYGQRPVLLVDDLLVVPRRVAPTPGQAVE